MKSSTSKDQSEDMDSQNKQTPRHIFRSSSNPDFEKPVWESKSLDEGNVEEQFAGAGDAEVEKAEPALLSQPGGSRSGSPSPGAMKAKPVQSRGSAHVNKKAPLDPETPSWSEQDFPPMLGGNAATGEKGKGKATESAFSYAQAAHRGKSKPLPKPAPPEPDPWPAETAAFPLPGRTRPSARRNKSNDKKAKEMAPTVVDSDNASTAGTTGNTDCLDNLGATSTPPVSHKTTKEEDDRRLMPPPPTLATASKQQDQDSDQKSDDNKNSTTSSGSRASSSASTKSRGQKGKSKGKNNAGPLTEGKKEKNLEPRHRSDGDSPKLSDEAIEANIRAALEAEEKRVAAVKRKVAEMKELIRRHDARETNLWVTQEGWNTIVECGTQSWKVHRAILWRESQWFRDILTRTSSKSDEITRVKLDRHSPTQMGHILAFMYHKTYDGADFNVTDPLDGEFFRKNVFMFINGASINYSGLLAYSTGKLAVATDCIESFVRTVPALTRDTSRLVFPLRIALQMMFEQGGREAMAPLRTSMARLMLSLLPWLMANEGFLATYRVDAGWQGLVVNCCDDINQALLGAAEGGSAAVGYNGQGGSASTSVDNAETAAGDEASAEPRGGA